MTTSLEFEPSRKEILFHRAKAVANDPDDRACRTKLCAEPVGDLEKLFREWDHWSWHRVTFYGDLKEPVYALADAVGWKVVEEAWLKQRGKRPSCLEFEGGLEPTRKRQQGCWRFGASVQRNPPRTART